MLDAGELPEWVQQRMGHEALQIVHEKYYWFIKTQAPGLEPSVMGSFLAPIKDEIESKIRIYEPIRSPFFLPVR